jgi:hypothetical protein
VNFEISPAFAYADIIWPAVMFIASFALGYIVGGCAQRG